MAFSFKMKSLLQLCFEQICRLMKKGVWNKCAKNPFSLMPVKIVDALLTFLLSVPNFIKTRDMRLLFQSGKISKFDLSTLLLDDEKELLLKWLTVDNCTNIRILSVLHPLCDASGASITAGILERCHNLEECHSKLIIDPNALKICNQLKTLRLHLQYQVDAISEDLHFKIVDLARSKPNLEVFSFCNLRNGFSAYKTIVEILNVCPKLTSIGFVDSLEALHHIRMKGSRGIKLNLQKCVWGINESNHPTDTRITADSQYCKKFPDQIQNAVSLCPAVETLHVNVYHVEALEHIVGLTRLTSLSLRFNYKSPDNVITVNFLLRRIGFFLEHLSLDINDTIPVNYIHDNCSNLKTLLIYGTVTVSERIDLHDDKYKSLNLERLHIWNADPESLYFLLGKCPKLIELYLGDVKCLDDQLMGRILGYDLMFPKLTVVGILDCRLTENGILMFLTRACNLKEIFFGGYYPYAQLHECIRKNDVKIMHYYDTFKLKKREFFIERFDPCSF